MTNPSREQLSASESARGEDEILARSNRIMAVKRQIFMVIFAIIFIVIVPFMAFLQYGLTSNFILLYGLIIAVWGAFAYTIYFYVGPQFSNRKYTTMGGYSPGANLIAHGEIYKDAVLEADEVQGEHLMYKPSNTVYLFGLIILIGFIFITFGFLFEQ